MASSEPPPPDDQPPPPQPPPPFPLPYKTWVLKVSIHCQACKRKVKKVLQSIEGVYITEIEEKQHKVTVTGNVEAKTLIKKLIKSGKNAELWQDNIKSSLKDKKFGINPKNPDQKPPDGNENTDGDDDEDDEGGENADGQKQGTQKSVRFDIPPPENAPTPSGGAAAAPKKKKKKKKKKSGGGGGAGNAGPGSNSGPASTGSEGMRVGPTAQVVVVDQGNLSHPYPQQGYVVNYSATHPTVGGAPSGYYMSSSPYTYPYTRAEVHSMRCRPLDSFEILSDENPNACFIM